MVYSCLCTLTACACVLCDELFGVVGGGRGGGGVLGVYCGRGAEREVKAQSQIISIYPAP